ncbi:MAG: CHAT domain-containing protein [Candidatus Tectomicrobia bacterium]|nr:CHAT domain-containing protein [Candidatus Tectomicrobia bacterium]
MSQGVQAFQKGNFEAAITHWTQAAKAYESQAQSKAHSDTLIYLSQAYQALGQYQRALGVLEQALDLIRPTGDQTQLVSVLSDLGNVYIATEKYKLALKQLDEAHRIAEAIGHHALLANILNNLGNLHAFRDQYDDAVRAYIESAARGRQAAQPDLVVRALSNVAMTAIQQNRYRQGKTWLDEALQPMPQLPQTYAKVYALINIGSSYSQLRQYLPTVDDLIPSAFQALNEAVNIADTLANPRVASYALGHLGRLYEGQAQYQPALHFTRLAISAAQQAQAPESLYEWLWQAGRIRNLLGDLDGAIVSYRAAAQTIQSIRQELSKGHGRVRASFREVLEPVFREWVDLLLQKSAAMQRELDVTNAEVMGQILEEAREAMEALKAAELQDYFQDECVSEELGKRVELDEVSETAAIVYPILLTKRKQRTKRNERAEWIELLVKLPGQALRQFTRRVEQGGIEQEITTFRQNLEDKSHWNHKTNARQLYKWLIQPFKSHLTPNINTLVFVPDGPLRTIPFGALMHEDAYLIEDYAIAITPGLNLLAPQPLARHKIRALSAGLTEPVGEFVGLPGVKDELNKIGRVIPSRQMLNKQFTLNELRANLQDPRLTVLHIASHAQFRRDLEGTFILTSDYKPDNKLTLDKLEEYVRSFRFRDNPLELITLSACETAAGDDRAALGLAGIAIKAGARSALATLWSIPDTPSAELVFQFYHGLTELNLSKAVALQHAQTQLMQDKRFKHPAFWAPFLLINNWL